MADPSMAGKELPPHRITVERGKIREFALATGDDNPLYVDREAAVQAGYRDVIAPPTFGIALELWAGLDFEALCRALALDPVKVLHGEEGYEYCGELHPGDEVTLRTRVVAVTEKQGEKGGGMWLLALETAFENAAGETVLKKRTTVVELK